MTRKQPLILLSTLREVDAVLEGTVSTARLTGKSAASISNAKRRGFYPRDTYAVMQRELARHGYRGAPSLWRQVEPATSEVAA